MPGTAGGRRHSPDRSPRPPARRGWVCSRPCGRASGLPGGSSLANLLVERRHVRNRNSPPPLTITQILAWADAHHERTGRWPTITSGPVVGASGETWQAVRLALYHGLRGLPGGSSLARLLAKERGVPNEKALPLLRVGDILSWADAYHVRHGAWPTSQSGPIAEAPGETWSRVHHALYQGGRGLRGGSSLARLLAERRGVRNIHDLPPITVGRILAWADAHFGRQGRWPNCRSGPILEAPGENWQGIENALVKGLRGLPGGSSLARLLARERGAGNRGRAEPGEGREGRKGQGSDRLASPACRTAL